MLQQITKGIRISATIQFNGTVNHKNAYQYAFLYHIKIENQSKDVVQLLTRHWKIMESLDQTHYVNGEGVVGNKPILNPGESHTYSSNCLLSSPLGAMKGVFVMFNFSTAQKFQVQVPVLSLAAPFILN
ncbi:MAG: Co2+/Mg2+ efflux protein ApaG [Flavobacteriaceae bacterium]